MRLCLAVVAALALSGAAKRKEAKKPLRPRRSKHAARLAVNGRAPPLCTKEFDLCRARRPKNFAAKRDCLLAEHRAELTDICLDYLELHGAGCNLVALHEMCPGARGFSGCEQHQIDVYSRIRLISISASLFGNVLNRSGIRSKFSTRTAAICGDVSVASASVPRSGGGGTLRLESRTAAGSLGFSRKELSRSSPSTCRISHTVNSEKSA